MTNPFASGATRATQASPMTKPPLAPLPHADRFTVTPLPQPLTSLIGREYETRDILAVARQSSARLITLTGLGGVGKTRLALHVAAELSRDFPDGVCFVPLGTVTAPEVVPLTIARSLAIRDDGDLPILQRLCQILRERRCLLVLDGFEQVVAAAPALTELLAACPRLAALITSRIRLRVAGEREYTVPPFPLPERPYATPLDELVANPAVMLFGERVHAARPDFTLTDTNAPIVAEICCRVDGLPLAIELTAAHGKVLPPAMLLDRLSSRLQLLNRGDRDRPPRQRTLRDAVASSEQLLTPDERVLFRRLSVFAGGLPAEAVAFLMNAGAVLAPTAAPVNLDDLESLVDHSLLQVVDQGDRPGPRFAMLDTIREYATEQLAASGEEETMRRRHMAYCLAIAERAEIPSVGPSQGTWLQRLDVEIGNVRAALAWNLAEGEVEQALRLAGALWFFWYSRGYLREGRRWLEEGLSSDRVGAGSISPAVRGLALASLGMLACLQADHESGVPWLRESLALRRELGDKQGTMRSLIMLGAAAELRGDEDEASAWMDQALALAGEVDDPDWIAAALERQGNRALHRGDYDRAEQLAAEALRRGREPGLPASIAGLLVSCARVALARGDVTTAAPMLAEALALAQQSAFFMGVLDTLAAYAGLAAAVGETERAVRLLGAVDAQRTSVSLPRLVRSDWFEQIQAAARSALAADDFSAAWAAGQTLPLAQAVAEAGEIVIDPDGRPSLPDLGGLTPREQEVLRLVASGNSNREIADALFISVSTVKGHIQHIFAKLDVNSRTAAALYAREHGIE